MKIDSQDFTQYKINEFQLDHNINHRKNKEEILITYKTWKNNEE